MAVTSRNPMVEDTIDQIRDDTREALQLALESRGVISAFQSLDDLGRAGRLSVFQVPDSIEADYKLDGEVIMLRRVIEGNIVYYGQEAVH